jgi:hypothetical protein
MGDRGEFIPVRGDKIPSTENPLDLTLAVTVPPEIVPEEIQLIMQNFVITQVSGPTKLRGKHSLFVGMVVVSSSCG